MRLLLDTHAFIWFLFGDPRLSPRARAAIEDLDNVCFISIASVWEIAIKQSIGKLDLQLSEGQLKSSLVQNQMNLLPIGIQDTEGIKTLPFWHRDPFDRMLICQAINHDLFLVSVDGYFDDYGVRLLW